VAHRDIERLRVDGRDLGLGVAHSHGDGAPSFFYPIYAVTSANAEDALIGLALDRRQRALGHRRATATCTGWVLVSMAVPSLIGHRHHSLSTTAG
jgi:hypothetical protein